MSPASSIETFRITITHDDLDYLTHAVGGLNNTMTGLLNAINGDPSDDNILTLSYATIQRMCELVSSLRRDNDDLRRELGELRQRAGEPVA